MAVLLAGIGGAALGGGVAWGLGYASMGIMMGMSIGWNVGVAVGSRIWGPEPSSQSGPRLDRLNIQSASYGENVPIVYGTVRLSGNVIWTAGFTEHEHE